MGALTLPLGARLRLWAWGAAARPLKRVVPLAWLIVAARAPARRPRSAGFEDALARFMSGRGRFPSRPPSNCLERSLGAYRLLCEHGASPDLVIGFRRDGEALRGHVWVEVDGSPFGEPPGEAEDHVTAVRYDATATRHDTANAPRVDQREL